MGKPLPSALATVMTSGTMPVCWCAKHAPVRPMPHWISSSMSSHPLLIAQRAQGPQVRRVGDTNAAFALHGFDQYRHDVGRLLGHPAHRVDIVKRDAQEPGQQRLENPAAWLGYRSR